VCFTRAPLKGMSGTFFIALITNRIRTMVQTRMTHFVTLHENSLTPQTGKFSKEKLKHSKKKRQNKSCRKRQKIPSTPPSPSSTIMPMDDSWLLDDTGPCDIELCGISQLLGQTQHNTSDNHLVKIPVSNSTNTLANLEQPSEEQETTELESECIKLESDLLIITFSFRPSQE
jgi:hypothetical protein